MGEGGGWRMCLSVARKFLCDFMLVPCEGVGDREHFCVCNEYLRKYVNRESL